MAIGPRISIGVFIPIALLAVAALLWTFVWFSAASRAREEIALWRADLVNQGGELSCTGEDGGGFPFRLEFSCANPVLKVGIGTDVYVLNAERLKAVAQAYDTGHMIFEIDAPLHLNRTDSGAQDDRTKNIVSAEDGLIRASLELEDGRASRLSVVFPAWSAMAQSSPIGARSGELHMRARRGEDAIDIAVSAAGAYFPDPAANGGTAGQRIDVESINLVTSINRPPATSLANLDNWLGRWRDGGGVADVRRISFDSDYLSGEGAGAVNLTPQDQLEGALNVRFIKLNQFAEALASRGVISDRDGQLLRGAVGLFAKSTNGQKSVTLPVRIRDSEVYMGPVKVAKVPALM